MLPKSKIRLSRHLHAQTTPYPEIGRWVRRGVFFFIILLATGIYFAARPHGQENNTPGQETPSKQILGEQDPAAIEYFTYDVKRGDTLFNLAQRYNISWQTLAELNGLKEPYLLKVGQKIKVPGQK